MQHSNVLWALCAGLRAKAAAECWPAGLLGYSLTALLALSFLLPNTPPAQANQPEADRALQQWRQATTNPTSSAVSSPVMQREAARRLLAAIDAGASTPLLVGEVVGLRSDFAGDAIWHIPARAKCGGVDREIQLLLWDWSRPNPPSDDQIVWHGTRGCSIEDDLGKKLRILQEIAKETNVSFVALARQALGRTDAEQQPASQGPVSGLSGHDGLSDLFKSLAAMNSQVANMPYDELRVIVTAHLQRALEDDLALPRAELRFARSLLPDDARKLRRLYAHCFSKAAVDAATGTAEIRSWFQRSFSATAPFIAARPNADIRVQLIALLEDFRRSHYFEPCQSDTDRLALQADMGRAFASAVRSPAAAHDLDPKLDNFFACMRGLRDLNKARRRNGIMEEMSTLGCASMALAAANAQDLAARMKVSETSADLGGDERPDQRAPARLCMRAMQIFYPSEIGEQIDRLNMAARTNAASATCTAYRETKAWIAGARKAARAYCLEASPASFLEQLGRTERSVDQFAKRCG